ncbi:MAG: hypothetical protein JNL13_02300 [Chitinophagaceae bacterium]|nr:hypothetical protein [Chitinophagaceae bacterium]
MTVCLPVAQAQRNLIKFDPDNCDSFTQGFRNIIVLDQRPDTLGTIGYVKLGLGNRPVKVETTGPLSQDIAAYYSALSKKAASQSGKDLIVVIYDFMATEDGMGLTKEFAFFRYRAEYFIGEQDAYHSIGMIDTTVEISAGDVTAKLMRRVDECLCSFCRNLVGKQRQATSDSGYTLDGVRELEASRRLNMPAYRTTAYHDGIYPSWEDFLQLKYTEDVKLLEYKKKHFVAQGISKKGKAYKYSLAPYSTEKVINPGRIIVFQGIPTKLLKENFTRCFFLTISIFISMPVHPGTIPARVLLSLWRVWLVALSV